MITETIAQRPLLRELGTGLVRPMRRGRPLASSADKGWDGFLVEEYRPTESHATNVCLLQNVIFLTLSETCALEWSAGGQRVKRTIRAGQISILPANDPYSVRLRAAGGTIAVSLEARLLACAAAEQGQLDSVEPEWVHGADDSILREVVLGLRAEAHRTDSSAAYAQSLAQALAAHVVRHYCNGHDCRFNECTGLAPAMLRRILQFMEEHLAENLSITELAEVVGLSACHFARMFKQSTQASPHRYLLNRRVLRAKQLLINSSASLAEVAAAAGFYDQAHLTRCFRQAVGTTPARFARDVNGRSARRHLCVQS